jgi:hypothetical protein
MLVTQSVCCDVFDGDVWLDKYCAKIFAIGIFLRILTGIDTGGPAECMGSVAIMCW